jgi:hypothetical protein
LIVADHQTRENNQEERDRKLAVAAVSEYVLRASSVQTTTSSQIKEHDMNADDPRIYVEIKKAGEAMFKRTPFVLHNCLASSILTGQRQLDFPFLIER